jgi:ABC-type lipoprotein export system ATPase subunit
MTVKDGEKIALKAPSGTGKTTLLNLVSGLLEPDSGEIYYNNDKITFENLSKFRRKICYLPQNLTTLENESVLRTIYRPFEFEANKNIKPERSEIEELTEKTNMPADILEKKFMSISGGEKQRIGIVLCLLLKREIMLLDEPTSALDKETSEIVSQLLTENDKTIIAASHDNNLLVKCDNIIELKNGTD